MNLNLPQPRFFANVHPPLREGVVAALMFCFSKCCACSGISNNIVLQMDSSTLIKLVNRYRVPDIVLGIISQTHVLRTQGVFGN